MVEVNTSAIIILSFKMENIIGYVANISILYFSPNVVIYRIDVVEICPVIIELCLPPTYFRLIISFGLFCCRNIEIITCLHICKL